MPEHVRGPVAGNCDVTYHIEARILKANKVVGDARREIIVMPSAEIPPPVDPEDLQNEYQLYATSSMSSFWKPKETIAVTVLSKEPHPMIFSVGKTRCPPSSTEVLIHFRTQKRCGRFDDAMLKSPFTDCEVTVALEAITYFVEHEKERMLSVAEAKRCSSTILKRKRFKPQKMKLKLVGWNRVDNELPAAYQIAEWETTASLTTILPNDVPRLPSFFSPLVSRRYAFDLRVSLGSQSGVSYKSMSLRVPVQMVHASVGKHLDQLLNVDLEEKDLKAPAYIP